MSIALAQYLKITEATGTAILGWVQNYSINETLNSAPFAAFNVASLISQVSSGAESITIDLQLTRDNIEMVELGLQRYYIAIVQQWQFVPPSGSSTPVQTKIAEFTGEFQSAKINDTSISLVIGSNLDSVESQVPLRTFTTTLAGSPPKL